VTRIGRWLSAGNARATTTWVVTVRRRTLRRWPPSGSTSTVRGVLDVGSVCDPPTGDGQEVAELNAVTGKARATAYRRFVADACASTFRGVKSELHVRLRLASPKLVGNICNSSWKRFWKVVVSCQVLSALDVLNS